MSCQAILPLFPFVPAPARRLPSAGATGHSTGVEYVELDVRDILHRTKSPRMPFVWTINPYRGCELACVYCYARGDHGWLGLDRGRELETRIGVKRGAAEALGRKLRRAALHGQPIAIGTATDPYQPAEELYGVTRSLLDVFRRVEGLQISLSTKSPLVLRDLDLLIELDRRHAVTVQVTVTTLDPELAARLEPGAPEPRARLEAVARLSEEGIATSVLCMPVAPGVNDGEKELAPLLSAARDAGAVDVRASALFFRPAARERYWAWLAEEKPHLLPRYRRLYGRGDFLPARECLRLLAVFRRLRLQHGFPRARPGRT